MGIHSRARPTNASLLVLKMGFGLELRCQPYHVETFKIDQFLEDFDMEHGPILRLSIPNKTNLTTERRYSI